jgi:hypothetical protein
VSAGVTALAAGSTGAGFAAGASGLGEGATLTGRMFSTLGVLGAGVEKAGVVSGGVGLGVDPSHHTSATARRLAPTASAAGSRWGTWVQDVRLAGAAESSRCTTGTWRSRC